MVIVRIVRSLMIVRLVRMVIVRVVRSLMIVRPVPTVTGPSEAVVRRPRVPVEHGATSGATAARASSRVSALAQRPDGAMSALADRDDDRRPVEFTRAKDAQRATKAGMGGVAARGAAQVRAPGAAAKRFDRGAPVREEGDKWIDDGSVRDAARAAVERQESDEPRPKRRPKALPGEVVAELTGQSDARPRPASGRATG